MGFPWKRDTRLLAEAKELSESKLYENEAIFMFGFQLGRLYTNINLGHLHLHFRSPNGYPDAIFFREDTSEVINVEFEVIDSDFEKKMHHDPSKCDLIVCRSKDRTWKNPIMVYELCSGEFYQPSK